ncbi:hypothetical protein HZH68_002243 [Vespula germanica]|uniref:Uncharacterized protein n=1 Tax=Vespula germanica TaxID=30212 RepID=A0A834KTJ1_VESGE|nr:hypothetical protein HZH68_002243 [Vespula germanica]
MLPDEIGDLEQLRRRPSRIEDTPGNYLRPNFDDLKFSEYAQSSRVQLRSSRMLEKILENTELTAARVNTIFLFVRT